jgi:hypothetical protein
VFYNNPVPNPPVLIPTQPDAHAVLAKWEHVVNRSPRATGADLVERSFTDNEAPLGAQLTNPEFKILTLTSGPKFWRVRSHQDVVADDHRANGVVATGPHDDVSAGQAGVDHDPHRSTAATTRSSRCS